MSAITVILLKVKETLNTAESLLGDLSGFKGFKREASELAEELQSYCKDQFESWVSEMMTAIDDAKQPLRCSLGCHCCNFMYVGLQYLRVTLGWRPTIHMLYIHNYMYTCVCMINHLVVKNKMILF